MFRTMWHTSQSLILAAFILTFGNVFAQSSDLKSKIGWTEEELLDGLTPVPTGAPQNDPWALPLISGCPRSCAEAGPHSADWTQLYDQKHLYMCERPLLFAFNVHTESSRYSTFRTCALSADNLNFGIKSVISRDNDALSVGNSITSAGTCGAGESTTNITIMAGRHDVLPENIRSDAVSAARALFLQLESHLSCGSTILFAKFGTAVVGLHAGGDIKKDRAAELLRTHW